jgi:hypothetical protein
VLGTLGIFSESKAVFKGSLNWGSTHRGTSLRVKPYLTASLPLGSLC